LQLGAASTPFEDVAYKCIGALYNFLTTVTVGLNIPDHCIAEYGSNEALGDLIQRAIPKEATNAVLTGETQPVSLMKFGHRALAAVLKCGAVHSSAGFLTTTSQAMVDFSLGVKECADARRKCEHYGDVCFGPAEGPVFGRSGKTEGRPNRDRQKDKEHQGEAVSSQDPNDKTGPLGAVQAHYISNEGPYPYVIRFENIATAKVPAQEVRITDVLDSSLLDLTIFSLVEISFADQRVSVPAGLSSFSTEVDLRSTKNLIVTISAALDKTTGVATWTSRSLDPITRDFPDDPLAGFLPPNTTRPQGEGSVSFTISPKSAIAEGSVISNKASIVFDTNAAIETNVWSSTIDSLRPRSSRAVQEPDASGAAAVTFEVSDDVSGVSKYKLLASTDGGENYAEVNTVESESTSFSGDPGKTYHLLSLAEDRAGHIELFTTKSRDGVSVTFPEGKCSIAIEKRCRKGGVAKGHQCSFTAKVFDGSAKRPRNVRFDLTRAESAAGPFKKVASGRADKRGQGSVAVVVKKTGVYRLRGKKPGCVSNVVSVRTAKAPKGR
jgi:hypothetical protein